MNRFPKVDRLTCTSDGWQVLDFQEKYKGTSVFTQITVDDGAKITVRLNGDSEAELEVDHLETQVFNLHEVPLTRLEFQVKKEGCLSAVTVLASIQPQEKEIPREKTRREYQRDSEEWFAKREKALKHKPTEGELPDEAITHSLDKWFKVGDKERFYFYVERNGKKSWEPSHYERPIKSEQ